MEEQALESHAVIRDSRRNWSVWVVAGILLLVAAGLTGCPISGGASDVETCLGCHNGRVAQDQTAVRTSPHKAIGCEACHGPGGQHLAAGGRWGYSLAGLQGDKLTAKCGQCHETATAAFLAGPHKEVTTKACLDCHDVHAEAVMPSSKCLDCHTPAGIGGERHKEHVQAETCLACHGTGHDPLAGVQGVCSTCHADLAALVDGGAHRLGAVDASPKQCTDCHGFTGEDAEAPALCVNCHTAQGNLPAQDTVHGGHAGVRSCADCHGPHSPAPSTAVTTCVSCHQGQADILAAGSHSSKSCSDCHNFLEAGVTPADLCARCHTQAPQGAAHVQHAQTQAIACVQCHTPHTPAVQTSTACVNCHKESEPAVFGTFEQGAHNAPNAGCAGCHDFQGNVQPITRCVNCHETEQNLYAASIHYSMSFRCTECHNPHSDQKTSTAYLDNSLCLRCHRAADYNTEDHTFHEVDPAGTGASRCTGCHMVPTARDTQGTGPTNHSFEPVPPSSSRDAIEAGNTPMPNSCLGAMGCHDGSSVGEPSFSLDSLANNTSLQNIFTSRYGS